MKAGITLVKYILFTFNLLFVVVGIILIALGGLAQAALMKYRDFITQDIASGPALLITVGVFITILAFLGCCGAIKENHCMTMTYAVLLTIIVILEIAGTITALMFSKKFEEYVKDGMYQTMKDSNSSQEYARIWNSTQHDLKCCGVMNYTDWQDLGWKVPGSCCGNTSVCYDPEHNPDLFKQGCLKALEDLLGNKVYVIGAIGLAFAFIEVLGIIFACCLASYIRHNYEVV